MLVYQNGGWILKCMYKKIGQDAKTASSHKSILVYI